MQQRVFVSSVMSDFEEYRSAARKAIISCNCEPVMLEDYPSQSTSSRNACLEAVASSDIYLAIIGARGGWAAPSGMLAVEEEFEEAQKHKLPVLVFIQDTDMDAEAERLKEKLSDYVIGYLRTKFVTPNELQKQIAEALSAIVFQTADVKQLEQEINKQLLSRGTSSNETRIHCFVAPERQEEVIDPVKIGSQELKEQIFRVAHSPEVGLLSYERSKKTTVGIDTLSLCEFGSVLGSPREDCIVSLAVNSKGQILLDLIVEKEVPSRQNLIENMIILESDVARSLKRSLSFVAKFLDERDPFQRLHRFLFNVAISGVDTKPFMKSYPSGSQVQLSMNRMFGGRSNQKAILAFDTPRKLTRSDFANENETLEPILEMLRRRLSG